jgi:diacylglycerol kinase (ATP)
MGIKMLGRHGRHLLNAIKYSFMGLETAIRNEAAFQQEIIILFIVIPLGFFWGKTGVERALLIGSWLFVMVIELINSAIESTVNRIGFKHHKLSGRAKDFGSASVFLAILLAIAVWTLVLLSG